MHTLHLIFHAHLDPTWLWPWQAGLDEALATCRSACDLLDRHPDTIFCQGEAQIYQWIETCDPALFARMQAHQTAGRWEVTGGWWTQPDCNFPSLPGLQHQLREGLEWLREKFGVSPRTAFNPDAFGHPAGIPGLLHEHGQDSCVLMRPQEHELPLPARAFRWRGCADGPEVVTFRIAGSYHCRHGDLDHLRRALTDVPQGVTDSACFLGWGDHGGGPSDDLIAWCRAQMTALPGVTLRFSSVERFMTALRAQRDLLPLVVGELQSHAIGCYSLHRPLKLAVRRAEILLDRAEVALPHQAPGLTTAWQRVCGQHFHDTLAGTCTASTYRQAEDQLGGAAADADGMLQLGFRRQVTELPPDTEPRSILWQAGDQPWDDWCEWEPWLEGAWCAGFTVRDQEERAVPVQVLPIEAHFTGFGQHRLLARCRLAAGEMRTLRLVEPGAWPVGTAQVHIGPHDSLQSAAGTGLRIEAGRVFFNGPDGELPGPTLELLDDPSDTWGHGLRHFAEEPLAVPQWETPTIIERGPLRAAITRTGLLAGNAVHETWRVYAGENMIELVVEIAWHQAARVLKLRLPTPWLPTSRADGHASGLLQRANDGNELPLHDLSIPDGERVAVVAPEIFALDATPERLRLTLLRAPCYAQHEPTAAPAGNFLRMDQGQHRFVLRFHLGPQDATTLRARARAWQRPPLIADCTRGMPGRFTP